MPSYTAAQILAMNTSQWAAAGNPVITGATPLGSVDVSVPFNPSVPSATIPLYSGDTGSPTANDYLGTFIDGFIHPFDTLTGQRSAAHGVDTGQTITNTEKAATGFWSFASDIPRVGTTLVGGLMIAAGLFALAGNSRVIQLVK